MNKPTDKNNGHYDDQEVEDAVISEIPNTSDNNNTESEDAPTENERAESAKTIVPFTQNSSSTAPQQSNVPVDDRKYIRFGTIFLIMTFGLFSLWAGLAPLSSALVSQGEVVVDSYRKSIQHLEGGIIENIYIRDGDKVVAGQPLIQLETTQIESQRKSNEKRLFSAKAELERLYAEQNFSTELTFSQALQVQATKDEDIASELIQQEQLLKVRLNAFKQEEKALETQINQIQQQIKGLNEQIQIQTQQVTLLEEEEIAFRTLFEEGLDDGQRSRELKHTVLGAKSDLEQLKSDIIRLSLTITETKLQIAKRKQDFLKDSGERIRSVQNNYYDSQERLEIATNLLEKSTIRAPENGIVVDLQIHTIGSVAAPGRTLLDIVPLKDSFVVEAKLMPQDINEVYQGQIADIRFSAFNTRITKVIEGEVIDVSADRLLNEQDQSSYYLARIKVTDQGEQDMADSFTDDMELKPGMPAEVMIRRGERTMFSYLLKPITDSFARSLKEK
ncbi:HlyD family type I secretion periplasmic adaptor subunit [Marinomonas sp. 2405UD68-3]|uniref:HlyD family type I secretion periplasmic adaptor subunit n=1 Tax=Marinomonas sp. 2405UD68-3 TaxID=3391835 RepID=UPI0039C9D845